jgi:hypothetical protein
LKSGSLNLLDLSGLVQACNGIALPLFGITKLDKEKNQCISGKNGSTEHSKGNKTVPGRMATTHTEDGHK